MAMNRFSEILSFCRGYDGLRQHISEKLGTVCDRLLTLDCELEVLRSLPHQRRTSNEPTAPSLFGDTCFLATAGTSAV